jgi:hypothetical protein
MMEEGYRIGVKSVACLWIIIGSILCWIVDMGSLRAGGV